MTWQGEAQPSDYEREEVESNAIVVSSGPESTTAEFERGDSAQTQDDGGLEGCNRIVCFSCFICWCNFLKLIIIISSNSSITISSNTNNSNNSGSQNSIDSSISSKVVLGSVCFFAWLCLFV